MRDYRGLLVWQLARKLAVEIRRAAHGFNREGHGSLRTQMIRATESVVLNISEGCGAQSQKEFARYLDIAIKSCSEIQGQLDLACGYGILKQRAWQILDARVIEIRRMLCGLRRKVIDDLGRITTDAEDDQRPTADR